MSTHAKPRHFLDIHELDTETLQGIISHARTIKEALKAGKVKHPLAGKQLAMIFEKPSTRTRVSFEVGIRQLGGDAIILNMRDLQLGRGESIEDTARVLSRYVNMIMLRTTSHEMLENLAAASEVPVINALSDYSHPCQIMADVMTFEEQRGPIAGKRVAWVGDGNNVCTSWIHAAVQFGFELHIATPDTLAPHQHTVTWAREKTNKLMLFKDPIQAVEAADLVVTDCWVSMGDEDKERRHRLLKPYRVDEKLMRLAKKDALFMHCLPAHRGEEVSASVIDGPQSVVFDEAENRLHVQKAIMLWCMGIE